MLEVRNLTKIYKTKNGADVHALDGVSLQFPETGMVFLLGKSGSGKSTLLNVCGGLDSPTDGEIIVKGRSSRQFSQSDFDSYRNTFVGFIFQEYNILNEFSVEDNIALALELQGKPKDKAAINDLLTQVDLVGYAKRKPNTLSGGQKQRIAIARALVKAPEIIMADEPTGALDSNTGKQVFETLKKLSRDKLVIVVSHDRDFAEQYGDRIIELKDGKILSDVSKTSLSQQPLTGNVNAVGEVLCVKGGASLTDADFDKIKAFLKTNDGEVILARDEQDVAAFKKVSRIGDDGSKEVFRDTAADAVEKKQYKPEDSRFIRSKLPARHATKIGLSGLKNKPIRLILTVLLCTVAFVMFGLLSTMSFYDSEATFRETLNSGTITMSKAELDYQTFTKEYMNGTLEYEYESWQNARFDQTSLDQMKATFGQNVFGGLSIYTSFNVRNAATPYWVYRVTGAAVLPDSHPLRQQMNGTYPAAKDEIAISTYMAESLFNCKIYDAKGEALELAAATDILGKTVSLNNVSYKVVGLFDAGMPDPKFDVLKDGPDETNRLTYELEQALTDGLYTTLLVNPERMGLLAREFREYQEDITDYRQVAVGLKHADLSLPEWGNAQYVPVSEWDTSPGFTALVKDKTAPADGEVVVSDQLFYRLLSDWIGTLHDDKEAEVNWEQLDEMSMLCSDLQTGGQWVSKGDGKEEMELQPFTDAQKTAKHNRLMTLAKQWNYPRTLNLKLWSQRDGSAIGELREYTIVGLGRFPGEEYRRDRIVLSDGDMQVLWDEQRLNIEYYRETSTNYKAPEQALYSMVYLPLEGDVQQMDALWELYNTEEFDENGTRWRLTSLYVDNLRMVDSMVKSMSQVFLYVGLVFAVFAILLFSNFISVSISQKKRDIGILRAVGARSLDVFKIFFSESFFIAFICVVLSTVGCVILCNILNAEIAASLGAALLVFGPLSFGVLVLIALATAVVATFLPVYNAAKKKPVDSIRAL